MIKRLGGIVPAKVGLVGAVLVLASVAGLAVGGFFREPGPGPRESGDTTYRSPLYVAMVARPATWASEKRGADPGVAPGAALGALDLAWYYGPGRIYAGAEFIQYLAGPGDLSASLTDAAALSDPIMILNEPDLAYWNMPPMSDLVDLAIALVGHWPGVRVAGPCVSSDLEYVRKFAELFQARAGRPMPMAAVCFHCYGPAWLCADRTAAAVDLARDLGVPEVWLTEFNLPPGLSYSIQKVLDHNGCLVRYLETVPEVGRYGFWAAAIRYGDGAPSDPVVGWQPLLYQHYTKTGPQWRLTALGRAYVAEPPSWADCLAGGYLRPDQVPEGVAVDYSDRGAVTWDQLAIGDRLSVIAGLVVLALLGLLMIVAMWDSCFKKRG